MQQRPPHIYRWVLVAAAVCALPGLAMLLGADFGSIPDGTSFDSRNAIAAAHAQVCGSLVHTLLEWSAVCTAIFVCVLCFVLYALTQKASLPVIGVAMCCAGAMDAFHILAADHLLMGVSDPVNLPPFTWALCRMFTSAILLAGVGFFAFGGQKVTDAENSTVQVIIFAAGMVVVSVLTICWCATADRLPTTMYADAWIKRPFDVIPLVLFGIGAVLVFPAYFRSDRSPFAVSLIVSLVPQMATQLYMAFGSGALFDSCFNVAHALKIVSYAIPCLGLMAHFISAFRQREEFQRQLVGKAEQLRVSEAEIRRQSDALLARNRELKEARAAAESASQAKGDFLASMSHEIRTPIAAVLGYSDSLLDESLVKQTPELLYPLESIRRNTEHLLSLVNDVLDMSKIEADRLEVERVVCDPRQIVQEVVVMMRGRRDPAEVELGFEFKDTIPARIQSDPTRIRQILVNLVGNALKFTERGTVTIVTEQVVGSGQPKLRFSVVDTGIGMTEEQRLRLFNPFTQADATTTRKYGGSGLGLYICRRLTDLLGGDISVESTDGAGTTVSFTVATGPINATDSVCSKVDALSPTSLQNDETEQPQKSCTHTDSVQCRILLVEDSPDVSRVNRFILKKAGAAVELAENGQEAVDLLVQGGERDDAALAQLDLILMDMQMPVLDGYEATRALREAGVDLPIIALTAHAMKGDREKCLAAGCDEYITKPVRREQLIDLVNQYAAPAAAEPIR